MALVSCELDELKREMETSFGDWCLIRKFIVESRGNNLLPPASNTIQNSFVSSEKVFRSFLCNCQLIKYLEI